MNSEKVRVEAEELYRNGSFYCSEAVVKSVIEGLGETPSRETIAMASGFPVGIGGAGCTCGAISGGVMAIGYFLGRSEAGAPEVNRCMAVSNELYKRFVARNKCTCCKILTRNMELGSKEHMEQCIRFTGEVAADCFELLKSNLPQK